MKNRFEIQDWMICQASVALLGKNLAPFDRLRANGWLHSWVALLVLVCGVLWLPLVAMAGDSVCAEVKIEIKQELTLERQAFEAHMRINNGLSHITLENISIVVNFTDEDGNPVEASSNPNSTTATFFVRLDDLQHIGAVDGTGTVSPSSSADIYWLIIPAPGSGTPPDPPQGGNISSYEGNLYYVGATLMYSIGGETHVTEVVPDYIYVKPMPQLFLDYFLPKDVYGDDAFTADTEAPVPFSLGVRVDNRGYGPARQLTIDSAELEIVDNEQGLLVDFLMQGTEVNGQAATPSLSVAFGDIEPNTSGVARWNMTCSLSGWFKDFSAEFSHADELGGELTSLIEAVNTHFLLHDVLVDLPGRDAIRDFLATASTEEQDRHVYRVYESESTDAAVADLSDSATLTPVMGTTATYTLALETTTLPSTDAEWFLYVSHKVPGALGAPDTWPWPVSAARSDGKIIAPENVWISKTRKSDPQDGWEYFVNLFDAYATTDATTVMHSYTVVFEGTADAPLPPVLQPIPDQTGLEGQPLSFMVEASCGQDESCTPELSVTPLPVGADFTDHGDGSGTFAWTPAIGQHGVYFLTVAASDGDLSTSQPITITIAAIPRYTITATPGTHGRITPSGAVTVIQGMDQSFTITPDTGYHIVEIQVDGQVVDLPDTQKDEYNYIIGATCTFLNVDADHTLEAVFAIKTYPILATAGTGGSISPSGEVTVEYGADQSFTITPNTGYHIADVLVDGTSVGAVSTYTFTNITGSHTIQAVFASGTDTHTITATAGANGSLLPIGTVTVEDGMDQSFTITAESGYHIADVLVDGMSVGAVSTYTFSNVTDDHTIEATFAADIITYTITATAGVNGSITPSGEVTVEHGTDQSFTIMPDPGYHIVDVLVDETSVGAVSAYMFTDVTSDHTIAVTFAVNTYIITATAGANGNIDPSGDVTVEHGAEQSFTITPDAGYYIDNVLVDGSSVGAVDGYIFTDVTGNHTLEAVFSMIPPTPTPQPLTISGQVRTSDGLTGLPEVALNGLPGSPTTDELGYYQADVVLGWSGTVTPQKLDYSFTPVFRSYSSLMVNQEQQDYTGTAPSQTLTIVLAGDGSGVVTGDGGITCGTVCAVTVEKYTQVYLSAIPDTGSIFAGAVGAECTPEGTCVLTMTEDTMVTVTFGLELEPTPTPTVGPEPTPTPTTPVIPEPATGFLMLLGLLALLGLGLGLGGKRSRK